MTLERKTRLVQIISPASAVSVAEELNYQFMQGKVCFYSSANYIYDFRNGLEEDLEISQVQFPLAYRQVKQK